MAWYAAASVITWKTRRPGAILERAGVLDRLDQPLGQINPAGLVALRGQPDSLAANGRSPVGAEQKQRALELVEQGWSWAQAAREVGVHKQTVGGWIKRRRVAARGDNPETTPPAHLAATTAGPT